MKASELIKELEQAIAKHGDLPVGFTGKHWWQVDVSGVEKTEMWQPGNLKDKRWTGLELW